MTLKELARKANVSESTASKALRNSKELHRETIEHVNKIARESGYFTEIRKHIQSNSKNKSFKFAILCPEIVSVHYTQIATTISDMLSAHNAVSEIRICQFSSELEYQIVTSYLGAAEIDGIITLSSGTCCDDARLPVIGAAEQTFHNYVAIDVCGGYEKAIDYLIDNGHRDIGFIGEERTASKQELFKARMAAHGLSADRVICSPYRFEKAGYEAIEFILNGGGSLPTAFLTAYDEIAMGAVSALLGRGIKVPDDVSVIGMNDVPAAAYFPVPLTTVGFDVRKLCEQVVDTALECVRSEKKENKKVLADMFLVIRKSSGAAKTR